MRILLTNDDSIASEGIKALVMFKKEGIQTNATLSSSNSHTRSRFFQRFSFPRRTSVITIDRVSSP